MLPVRPAATGNVSCHQFRCPLDQRHGSGFDDEVAFARGGHLGGVPDQAEARDVGAGVHGTVRQPLHRFGGGAVQLCHRSDGGGHCGVVGTPELQGGGDHAGAERLGQDQPVAELCARVYSIEYLPELAKFAAKNLDALGYRVELRTGDGYAGWPEAQPFDVIVVTAAPESVPAPLLDQLALGGRLVIPVGPEDGVQELVLYVRRRPGRDPSSFERRSLAEVRFVPFLGDAGGP
jgi:hypothetical protein